LWFFESGYTYQCTINVSEHKDGCALYSISKSVYNNFPTCANKSDECA